MSWRRCSRVHGPISRIAIVLASAQGVRKVESGKWKVESGRWEGGNNKGYLDVDPSRENENR